MLVRIMKSVFEPLRRAKKALHPPFEQLGRRLAQAAVDLADWATTPAAQPPPQWRSPAPPEATFLTLLQPQTGVQSPALRRVLEPVVAVLALGALGSLAAWAATSLVAFLLACILALAILTQVFGLSIMPTSAGTSSP